MAQFGWHRSDFALVASAGVLVFLALPVWGRLTDIFGVRRVAVWGVLCQPLCYLAFSFMTGDIRQYLVILIVLLVGGCATTVCVYGRIIMERYSRARGLALAIVVSAPALLGAIGTPLLSIVIQDFGWRAAFRVVALVLGALGFAALALVPRETAAFKLTRKAGASLRDYPLFLRQPAFLLIFFGMMLNFTSQILNSSQMGLILSDHGAIGGTAARILSIYAVGVVAGRLLCGLALDRFRPYIVAALIMAMPGIGQLILATPVHNTLVLQFALLLMGLTTGAEGDIAAFLVMRYFPSPKIFGSVSSIVSAGAGSAAGLGGVLLSLTFRVSPSFNLFLVLGAIGIFVASMLFLLLGFCKPMAVERIEGATQLREDAVQSRSLSQPIGVKN